MNRHPRIKDTPPKFNQYNQLICRNCDNEVSQNRRHYCSIECMSEFNRNNSWYWVRKDVLQRDRYTCKICKTRKRKHLLDIDHIIPVRMNINYYDKQNLRTLCKDCHKAKTKLDAWALTI